MWNVLHIVDNVESLEIGTHNVEVDYIEWTGEDIVMHYKITDD